MDTGGDDRRMGNRNVNNTKGGQNIFTSGWSSTGSRLTQFNRWANELIPWSKVIWNQKNALVYKMTDIEIVALAVDYTKGGAFDVVVSLLKERRGLI